VTIFVCYIFLFVDDRRDVSRYGEDNRGYGGSQGGGRGRGGYDKDGRGPMTGSR
jgi:transcription initiation factor TFIID subunit 15